ncbi:50S ribosomal protein L3 N(5)-glutamine methyltransferase [Legionella londiniensis]|uniref:Ribosomal protein uL3 glutamine methyltransferase n=1 Tax=Legionella londiniensis TaxID=45068 RepID=A0A0W0VRK6_9GAMM|nr:50S ribosomal protein L3 N(5)-glutamine methyltransferase [Legionella londiniensis]KTD22634.1 N5-glutamine S-adenosyl-L-methionine-dependent methyltransferase [Legionella londiniensis]STX92564.1 adenine specific methylase [Legionella londiniensis]
MAEPYNHTIDQFQSILDYLRYGLSCANTKNLYYGHGTDNAWDDMLALILGSLSLPLDVNPELLHARLTKEEKQYLCEQLRQRIEHHKPTPYLTQKAYFFGLSFYVDERVLIPRSPIGELINQQFTPWIAESRVKRILDLCTGSGCLAIACCHAFPDAEVDAADISRDALAVAEINRKNHGLEDNLRLFHSDCFDSIPKTRYDIIVSNPPYVSREEIKTLPKEYHHEPKLALEAEQNGLAIVEKILREAQDYLSAEGILVVEVGNSEEALVEAYPDVPFTWLEFEHGGAGVFLLTHDELKAYFS